MPGVCLNALFHMPQAEEVPISRLAAIDGIDRSQVAVWHHNARSSKPAHVTVKTIDVADCPFKVLC